MKLSTSREGQSLEGYHSTNPILKKDARRSVLGTRLENIHQIYKIYHRM